MQRSLSLASVTAARPRSPSEGRVLPLPKLPGDFANLGEFVQHHRNLRGRSRDQSEQPQPSEVTEALIPFESEPSEFVDEDEEPPIPPPPPIWEGPDAAAELHAAALQNDAPRVRSLVAGCDSAAPVPVDIPNDCGETAAVCAARSGCKQTCAELLNHGADPLARDCCLNAFQGGVWPDERKPNKNGVPASEPGELLGRTVVYHLRLQGTLNEVLALLCPMVRVSLVRALADALEILQSLPALQFAVSRSYQDLLALLLTHSATLPPREGGRTVNTGNRLPPLGASLGRDSNAVSRSFYNERAAALLLACTRKEWRCAEVLLAASIPRCSLDTFFDRLGRTALHAAASAGQLVVVRMLLDAGASTSVYSDIGRQPLHDACHAGHVEVVQALLDASADPLALTCEAKSFMYSNEAPRRTPYEVAEARGHHAVCRLLPRPLAATSRK